MKKCPYCAGEIQKNGSICPSCGRDVPQAKASEPTSKKQSNSVSKKKTGYSYSSKERAMKLRNSQVQLAVVLITVDALIAVIVGYAMGRIP